MRKMMINGVRYLWADLSFSNPDHTRSGSVAVAFPAHDPKAEPVFLIDNNGENPFAGHSWANWLPAPDVRFVDPVAGEPVSWDQVARLEQCASAHCDSAATRRYEIFGSTIRVWLCERCAEACEMVIEEVNRDDK